MDRWPHFEENSLPPQGYKKDIAIHSCPVNEITELRETGKYRFIGYFQRGNNMEHLSHMSTLKNEVERELSKCSLLSKSNECSVDVAPSSFKTEEREADDSKVDDTREFTNERPAALATRMCGATGSWHGAITMTERAKCPCCQQSFDDKPSTLNEPHQILRYRQSLLALSDEEHDYDDNIDELMFAGSLVEGVHYHPVSVLVQGWLHKKGTGKDWLGSRSWKARWARVISAKVDGYSCDVPLMQIYWHSSAPIPSTVILLESTVVLAVDLSDKDQWDSFRFEIRHAATKENKTISVTRTFTAPKVSRDTWVYVMSKALLYFQKDMHYLKKSASARSYTKGTGFTKSAPQSSTPNRPKGPTIGNGQIGDHSSLSELRQLVSPPISPLRPNRAGNVVGLPRCPRSPKPRKEKQLVNGNHPLPLALIQKG